MGCHGVASKMPPGGPRTQHVQIKYNLQDLLSCRIQPATMQHVRALHKPRGLQTTPSVCSGPTGFGEAAPSER